MRLKSWQRQNHGTCRTLSSSHVLFILFPITRLVVFCEASVPENSSRLSSLYKYPSSSPFPVILPHQSLLFDPQKLRFLLGWPVIIGNGGICDG